MAVNTAVTKQTGAAALGSKIVLYQREINFATTNLDDGDWFDLFQMPANALVLSGMAELILTGTASANFTIGVEDGTTLLTATNLDGTTGQVTAFTNTVGIIFDSTTIDLAVDTAKAVLGKVRVTAVVALCDDLA